MRRLTIAAAAVVLGAGLGAVPLRGAVTASSPPDVQCVDMMFTGTAHNLTVPNGHWCDVEGATITGNLEAQNATGLGVGSKTLIDGNLHAQNLSGAADPMAMGRNFLCNSTVHGDVQIHNTAASGPWNIGQNNDAFHFASCGGGGSFVGGNLQFFNNASPGNDIFNSDVEGNLQCQGNGGLVGGMNGADGNAEGQCAGLAVKGDATEPQAGTDGDGPE